MSKLVCAVGKPITSTSANLFGQPPRRNADEILNELDERLLDLVIDAGELPKQAPSTIVRAYGGQLELLREGAISREQIETLLQKESYN